MKNPKVYLSILFFVCGTLLIISSLLLGWLYFREPEYLDIKSFPVQLRHNIEERDEGVGLMAGNYSFWLKLPNRQIEEQDVRFYIKLFNGDSHFEEEKIAELDINFNSGYFLDSTEEGEYYYLGNYNFNKDYLGNIVHGYKGSWAPIYGGELIIRQAYQKNIISWELLKLGLAFSFGFGFILWTCRRMPYLP